MLTASNIDAGATNLVPVAARLATLAGAAAPDLRPAAWQDGLDLLAMASGLKPVCLLGRGDSDDADWLTAARGVADALGLHMLVGTGWQPAVTGPGFPDWYDGAVAERMANRQVLYIWRDASVGARVARLCAGGRVDPEDEAATLGYPLCCVAQHHAQALTIERLILARVIRLAGGDPVRQRRLIAAGVVPAASSADDHARLAAAGAIAPQPYTSVNRCVGCAADTDGPAARLGERYRALAHALRYPAPPTVH
jgi:hypothetical protein